MQFKKAILDNGLTIIGEVNPAAASMAAGFFVRTGARDETPETAGVSHFLEHMVFKGTARRSPLDVNREFDEMGATYNAFTSEECTIFFGAVLPEFQERLLDLLADILRPSLRKEDFDIEKNVILEEIAMYEDSPKHKLFEKLLALHFDGHPLGNSVLGTCESIGGLKQEQMLEYFNSRYSPGNITFTAVGNIDFDAVVEKLSHACASWRPCEAPRIISPHRGSRATAVVKDDKVAREHIGLMTSAPSNQDTLRYAAELTATIIGDDTGSRLYYALVEKALADEASMMYTGMDGEGALCTFISADPDRAAEALAAARDELKRFADEGPTDSELQAAKNKTASSATLKGELPMGRLTVVGMDWLYMQEYIPLAEQIDMMFAVTRDDIMRVVRESNLADCTTLALGPLEKL